MADDDFITFWTRMCEEWNAIKDEMIDAGKKPSAHDVTTEQYRRMYARGEDVFAARRRIRNAASTNRPA